MTRRLPLTALLLALALAGCQAPLASLRVSPHAESPTPRPVWGAGTAPQAAGVSATPGVVADQLIAELVPGESPARWMARPEAAGFSLRGSLRLGGRHLLKLGLPAGLDRQAAQRRLAGAPGVRRAVEDPVPHPAAFAFTQADTRLAEQWAHQARFGNTLNAWDKVSLADQAQIIVAVLDTGLDVTHPEFAGRLVGARNFTATPSPDANVTDEQGHGTHVTGILAATGDNGAGVAGVAWGVSIMPVKVLGSSGTGGTFDILAGITYATNFVPSPDTGARVRVINMSLGSPTGGAASFYTEAIAEAHAAGIVVVAATGNDGRSVVGQPANTPHAIAVGATGHYLNWEALSGFSNYGDRLDLVAPGEDILSTFPVSGSPMGQTYGLSSGTSMSCPYVAGVAALIVSKYDKANAALTPAFADKVRERLLLATDDLGAPGRDPVYGAGRLNASRAVTPATIDAAP